MIKKIITLIFVHFVFLFFALSEGTNAPPPSISEGLQGPYEYQTVNVITGEYCESHTDLSLQGPHPLNLRRYYTSQDSIAQGWHFNHPNILYAEEQVLSSLHYTFDQYNRLTSISTTPDSPQQIRLHYNDGDVVSMEAQNDAGQQLAYVFKTYRTSRAAHPYVLTQVTDAAGKKIHYHYIDHPRERKLLLRKREEPEGRYLITEYYDAPANNVGGKIVIIDHPNRDPRIGRVKQQKAPVGPDNSPVIINRFFYEPGLTVMYDALGNKTVYHYGNLQKFTGIDHYWDEDTLYRKERIFWSATGEMTGRAIEDQSGVIHLLHTYEYDANGNMCKTVIWGDLSGTSTKSIELYANGQPTDPDIEHYATTYTYSEDGKYLLQEREDSGLVKRYRYCDGRLSAVLTGNDEQILRRNFYHYDASGTIVAEIEDDGSSCTESDLSQVTERRFTRLLPEQEGAAKGKPAEIETGYLDLDLKQEVLLNKTLLTYTEQGNVGKKVILDAHLNCMEELVYTYDAFGRLTSTADHNGEEKFYTYDLHGNLICQIENDKERRFFYDYANRLIKEELYTEGKSSQSATYRYDFAGRMIAAADNNGNETRYSYDPLGRLTETILPAIVNDAGTAVHPATKENHDIFDRVVLSADPAGFCTETHYTARGAPAMVIHPDGSREFFVYNLDGSLKKHTSQQEIETHYEYDIFSRVIRENSYDSAGVAVNEKIYSYSSFRLLSEYSTVDGWVTYAYDGAGRQVKVVKEHCLTQEIAYDAAGQIACRKQWYGEHPDAYVLETVERDSSHQPTALSICDAQGQLLQRREIPLKKTSPDDPCEKTTLDALNRPVVVEKRNFLGALLAKKELCYDLAGNKTLETHHVIQNGETMRTYGVRWTWGPGNRLESMTEGDGTADARTTVYRYGSRGVLEQIIKPDNTALLFTYDSQGRVSRLHSTDGTIDYFYCYNAAGKVTEVVDKISGTCTTRVYDRFGRMVQETLANGLSLEYGYDLLGRLCTTILPDRTGICRKYDALHLKEVARLNEMGEVRYSHCYTSYDGQGRLLAAQLIKDLGSINYAYDGQALSSICSPFLNQQLGYDEAGRIVSLEKQEPAGKNAYAYTYDDLGQLVAESGPQEHFCNYDSLGNPLPGDDFACRVDGLNQLIERGGHAMRYDKNGQMVEYQSDGQRHSLCYDALGRLLSVDKDDGQQVTFTYDPYGRRLTKVVSNHEGLCQLLESYLWEGENEIGSYDEKGSLACLRILGLGLGAEVGAAIAMEINQKVYAPIHDHRGNLCSLIYADNGETAQRYDYSAFGVSQELAGCEEAVHAPWQFSGKRVDAETGLVYFGKRYYMPTIGRWISKDPMGTPESINRYLFSLNQPVSRVDPLGLFSVGDLWSNLSTYFDSACYHASFTWNALKNRLNFEDYIRPAFTDVSEFIVGQTLLQLAGYYQDRPEAGTYGKGELNDKVRITLINGILNARCNYKQSLDFISNFHGGENIHYLFDATKGWTNDMLRAFFSRFGYISPVSHQLAGIWRQLIEEMGGVNQGGLVIHYAHSIGAAHTKNALSLLTSEERAMIRIYTFGSPTGIDDTDLESVRNFISYRDGVALLDPIGFFSGLFGLSDTIDMVGSPWGIPFVEHTLNGGVYLDIIKMLGIQFLSHYVGTEAD